MHIYIYIMPMAIHQSCVAKSRFREINFSVKKKKSAFSAEITFTYFIFFSSNFF